MFPSKTAVYNDNDLIGTDATTAQANFDEAHPLYRLVAEMASLRKKHAALRKGRQVVRHYEQQAGVFAASRFDPESGAEYGLAFNTAATPRQANVAIGYDARAFERLSGACPARVTAPGSAAFDLPPFGWAVCRVSETAR